MKRVVDFVHAQGGKIGLQLAHAGRKASTRAPWVPDVPGPRGGVASKEEGGWPNDGESFFFEIQVRVIAWRRRS